MNPSKMGIEIEVNPPTETEVNDKFIEAKKGEKEGRNSNGNKIKKHCVCNTKNQAKWKQKQHKKITF